MGDMQVPTDAYYGASTQRAVLNFPISDLRLPTAFNRALALIKQAAAQVNMELGLLDSTVGEAIVGAAREIIDGRMDDQFVVDVFQTGSGTSTNMNANEVIANRAAELLGSPRGTRGPVHPNDHVNLGQASNDAIPTAIHIAAARAIQDELVPALEALRSAMQAKADEFMPIIKTGRTHLQDATPIRLGQEFLGYAGQAERASARVRQAQDDLCEVALGGTAVGTGVNTHPEFASRVCARLSDIMGIPVRETTNHFQAQSTLDTIVAASSALKTVAVGLMKVANDVRWLGSGPRAGIGEIALPEVQPGSSIMPGKVNPVIPEFVCQVAAQVIGNDAAIAIAGQSGNFEINVMMPLAAYNLLQSVQLLASVTSNFVEQCVKGIEATEKGP
jgi:fumarate hydratase class II